MQTPVSVLQDRTLTYPEPGQYFSPDQRFPEYPWAHVSGEKNAVYAAVRQCLANAGLDAENFGRPNWNPLGAYISPGQKVFVLCNFVQQQLRGGRASFQAKCTHGSVIRAMLDYVVIALKGQGSIRFGNAPLQSCNWSEVTAQAGAVEIEQFYSRVASAAVPVQLTDLRQHIIQRSSLGTVETRFHANDTELCTPVDLGSASLLESLCRNGDEPHFRVLDYDYRRTQRCHSPGRHLYLMSKHILDSDVVLSLPKLKTHEKVGITCGIKGCVGAVGHKDCLAHHRLGPPRSGGDEYPDGLAFLKPLSALHDKLYTHEPGGARTLLQLAHHYSRMVVRRFTRALSGSWPGNDTCWRMAVDLARILEYADASGRLQGRKQRTHLMLTDGIVAGEGDGPLSPQPVRFGYLSFSDNVAWGDYVNCLAMGFDPEKIPMIRESLKVDSYPLAGPDPEQAEVSLNAQLASVRRLRSGLGHKFLPAREWRGHL